MTDWIRRTAVAAAFTLLAGGANATTITWNFGTSGGTLLNPSGTFTGAAAGTTQVLTPTNGQEAVFSSAGYNVGAFGWCNGGNCAAKVTQQNSYATVDWQNKPVVETGIGVCNNLCTGGFNNPGVSDAEWLTIALNDPLLGGSSHAGWSLESIVFGNILASPTSEVEFWFSNSPLVSTAKLNKIDDTILQSSALCVGGIGPQGSCQFDFAALNDPDLNSYDYLYITSVDPHGDNQPVVVVQSLVGRTVPEAAAYALFAAGLLGFGLMRRRLKAA